MLSENHQSSLVYHTSLPSNQEADTRRPLLTPGPPLLIQMQQTQSNLHFLSTILSIQLNSLEIVYPIYSFSHFEVVYLSKTKPTAMTSLLNLASRCVRFGRMFFGFGACSFLKTSHSDLVLAQHHDVKQSHHHTHCSSLTITLSLFLLNQQHSFRGIVEENERGKNDFVNSSWPRRLRREQ